MRDTKLTHSEATIQAEFYHQCRLLNATCHLEFISSAGRLDILLLGSEGQAIAIIECKTFKANFYTNQIKRYKAIGLPVYILNNFTDAAHLADKLYSLHCSDEGIPIETLISDARGKYGKIRSTTRRQKLMETIEQCGGRYHTEF